MMKKICMISFVLHFAAAGSGCASGNDKKAAEAAPAKVYMTRDISPAGMKAVYEALGRKAEGKKVAVKLSTGEPGGNNFLQPALIGDLVKSVKGTIVECNTAYGGGRAKTEDHLKAAADHGFTAIAPVDIMDAEGEVRLPVEGCRHLKYDIVGSHFPEYDFVVVLSHFKGHAMGGFGGAIKNISIGIASCACPLQRMPRRQNSRTVPSILRWRKTALSSTIPTSAPTPVIGCQRCRRSQRNMGSRSKPFTSPKKRRPRMCLHLSQPMLCSRMVGS